MIKQTKKISFNKNLLLNDIKNLYLLVICLYIYIFVCYLFNLRVCPISYISGFPCPACGITRSLFMLLKGNITDSLKFHPFSIVVVIYAVFFVISRYFFNISIKKLKNIFLIIGCFMIFFYIYRMINYFPDTEPMSYNHKSLFYYIYSKLYM